MPANVMGSKRSPALVTECGEGIVHGVIPGSDLKLAGAATGQKSLCVNSSAREERFGKSKRQQHETQGNSKSGTLNRAKDADYFTLTPGRAPDKGNSKDQHASGTPQKNTSRSLQDNRARGDN